MNDQDWQNTPAGPDDPDVPFWDQMAGRPPSSDDYRRLLESLWNSCGQEVFLFCYAKLQNLQDARDICQDVFVKAMEWLQTSRGSRPAKVNFPAWLRRIARNLIIDRFRRGTAVREQLRSSWSPGNGRDPYADRPDTRASDPLDNAARAEEIEALRRCIEMLPERKRRILVMRDLDGNTYTDIARQTGVPVSTVGVTLHRTRRQLRDCVEMRLARAA